MAEQTHLTSNREIGRELILGAIDQLDIFKAVIKVADTSENLKLEDTEKYISVEIVNELPVGSQVPMRDTTVTDAEELKITEISARAKGFKGTMQVSTADLKALEEAKDLNPDDFLKKFGAKFRRPVKSAIKSLEIALQGTDESSNSELTIPSLYEMTKQGVFAGTDGEDYPAFQPQFLEVAGNKAALSEIEDPEVFPQAFTYINQLIRAINKCGTKATTIFAGSNAYEFLTRLKDNNKHLVNVSNFDFTNNKYLGLELVEMTHGKWTTDADFSNRLIIIGEDTLQVRANDQHLTATDGDGIEPLGDSRTMFKMTVFYYFLISVMNRAGTGQLLFKDLEMPGE